MGSGQYTVHFSRIFIDRDEVRIPWQQLYLRGNNKNLLVFNLKYASYVTSKTASVEKEIYLQNAFEAVDLYFRQKRFPKLIL
jgi:hypothetical protein